MARSSFPGFPKETFGFLNELAAHNQREWFDRNKPRYEQLVREPALEFIRAIRPNVSKVSPHFVADDRKVGGSLMRVNRDTRFAKDKTPYKTNIGIQFRHTAGKDVHAPGLYFHVASDGCFLGVGMWHPEAAALGRVRQAIVERAASFKRVRDAQKFRAHFELGGESLKRPPQGYAADHPLIEDLKRKDHIALCKLSSKQVVAPGILELVSERFLAARAYLGFLTDALGLPF